MRTGDIETLFDHHDWATERVLQAAIGLDPERFAAHAPEVLADGRVGGIREMSVT